MVKQAGRGTPKQRVEALAALGSMMSSDGSHENGAAMRVMRAVAETQYLPHILNCAKNENEAIQTEAMEVLKRLYDGLNGKEQMLPDIRVVQKPRSLRMIRRPMST